MRALDVMHHLPVKDCLWLRVRQLTQLWECFFLKSGNPEILSLYSQIGSLSHLFSGVCTEVGVVT